MSKEIHQLHLGPLTTHAFNRDRSQVAVCPNSSEVWIYEKSYAAAAGKEWTVAHVLRGHDKLVTSIDWAPTTNRIVTCSQDRNAYVWNWDTLSKQWKPTLVLLRINRAATHVKWSPLENKFAVASGARCISVCYFEEDNDWWISKHLRRPIRSTVLSLDWHPNNVLLAAGSSDMKTRVFSAYIKNLDSKPAPSPWGERLPFHTLCAEYANGHGGWVHDVAFSPDGAQLAYVGHDAALYVAEPAQNMVHTIKTQLLPFSSLIWITPNSIVAVGHDCMPVLFSRTSGGWTLVEKLDQSLALGAADLKKSSSAFHLFKQLDSRAQSTELSSGVTLNTIHQNTVTLVRAYAGERGAVSAFSTSGVDGKLTVWDVQSLEQSIAGLTIA